MSPQKIFLAIVLILGLQSCGFQTRKYTTGRYFEFARNHYFEKADPLAEKINLTEQDSDKTEVKAFIDQIPNSIASVDKLEHPVVTSTRVMNLKEVNIVDTIKIPSGKLEEEKAELRPPKELQPLVIQRRRDTFYTFLSCAVMIIVGFITFYSPSYWAGSGLTIISLVTTWMSVKTLKDLLKMRKQMKKIPLEEKNQKWYHSLKIKNTIASIFIPFYLFVLYMAILLAIFGVVIFFEI